MIVQMTNHHHHHHLAINIDVKLEAEKKTSKSSYLAPDMVFEPYGSFDF